MARKSIPLPLTLPNSTDVDDEPDSHSPLSPRSKAKSHSKSHSKSNSKSMSRSPRSPFRFHASKSSSKKVPSDSPSMQAAAAAESQHTPSTTRSLSASHILPTLSTLQPDLGQEQKERPARSGFFANYKASKNSHRSQKNRTGSAGQQEDRMSRDADRPAMHARVSSKDTSRTESSLDRSIARRAVGGPSRSEVSLESTGDSSSPPSTGNAGAKKNRPKPFSILSRSKSIRDDHSPREPSPTKSKAAEADKHPTQNADSRSTHTPPDQADNRSFRSMVSSTPRKDSEDRQRSLTRDMPPPKEGSKLREQKEQGRSHTIPKENGRLHTSSSGHGREGFLNNLKSSASKGAGALSKGLFGKGGSRSGSTHEKEAPVDDEHYQLKVLNLNLVEQTRLTRISKKLEDSKDKTEFWMPAFPWRAIDYLNYKGSDVEGLYRVPGSGPQIKKWQRRFDEEFDIDLFEQDELYDINIIGSMLKAWLRELPDELFPKSSQDRINRECDKDQEEVPQLLIDELSNLSPFNYYLLFAITCHLSLLLAHSDKNKMDYRNLCICFQPCMKIDAFCFKFLVCNWRECWKGCKTEQFYIEQEYILFDMVSNSAAEGRDSTAVESHDERNVSSSDSSKPSSVSIDQSGQKAGGSNSKKTPQSLNTGASNTINTALTVVNESPPAATHRSNEMRPLSPIKPLSPIGF
ncbi:uncharacterized protein L3040_009140 [Drepanopeziza brunnea f. sp. 'multigermtubi']|uniref:uncharacterized protein n=1 Tax=Drepanopeziza brunnea f. sp. 'multigermtubi' TaxID=698441 RepID=UPI0023970913|nr:hypothetical protein L3040_009140 [Drepanopeziza brunnea f. sp. 'multigermtubi']